LVPEDDRAEVVGALAAVDYVTIFAEDTPLALIRALRPDVLVKGGDWPPDQIVGADLVRARGGSVHSLPFAPGYSTTALLKRIRNTAVPSPKSQTPERRSPKSQIPNPKGPPARRRPGSNAR
jgi:D-beta-D-heptose 7-phosphate kinase/D-beta-D-heptose 1-phosphate adenosyltransferase